MTGKVHALFGGFIGYYVLTYQCKGEFSTLAMTGIGVIGALAPDIDHMNSKISRKLPLLSFLASSIFGHRKFLHTPIFVFLLWCFLHEFNLYGFAFCMGYAGHILQDTLTKEGIPLFYPITKKKISLLPFRSGSGFDYITTFVLVGLVLFLRAGTDLLKMLF